MTHPSILGLPTEVLNQILDHAIPVSRLARHEILDAEWKRDCAEPRSVPPLLFVNKALSRQAGNVFYSKAVLELTPVKPPGYILNALGRPQASLDLAVSLNVVFAPIPAQLLARIRKVFIYSGQRDAISAEGYDATLRWLIDKTDVKYVYLSQRLRTRLRKFRVNLDCAVDFMQQHADLVLARTIEVYATHERSYWEQIRMREMTKATQGNPPPPCQYFLTWPTGPILLDPRWDARISDDGLLRQKRDEVANCLDALAAEKPLSSPQRGEDSQSIPPLDSNNRWLYQICFVVG